MSDYKLHKWLYYAYTVPLDLPEEILLYTNENILFKHWIALTAIFLTSIY